MMNELFSVKDHVVVITGGTGVLGACIGRYLASQGAYLRASAGTSLCAPALKEPAQKVKPL